GQGLFTGLDALEDFGTDTGRSIETVHPFTSLRGELNQPSPVELLRVRTSDTEPFYLKLTSLDRFTGQGWTQSRLRAGGEGKVSNWEGNGGREPPLDADIPRIAQQTTVQVRGLTESSYLPMYANPTAVTVDGDWRWDDNTETVFSARDRTAERTYQFTSQRVPYSGELLAQAPPVSKADRLFDTYTALDGPVRPQLRGLVQQLAPAGQSQIDTVRAIEAHFDESNGFRYTERTTIGSSGDALVDFLANKQGFCEQYASAMAYLVRATGIPARVAIGYSRGTDVPAAEPGEAGDGSDYISINSRDAHAWTEVYFRGMGWVPFDPTPAAGPGRTADTSWSQAVPDGSVPPSLTAPPSDAAPSSGTAPSGTAAVPETGEAQPTEPNLPSENFGPASQATGWPTPLGIGVLALLALTLLVGPAVYRCAQRRRRLERIRGASASEPAVESTDSGGGLPQTSAYDAAIIDAATIAVFARAGRDAHTGDAADAAWQEFTDTAHDLRLLPRHWARSHHTPRELCAQLETWQHSERDRHAIEFIAAAQERNRYARDPGSARGLYKAVRTARLALIAQASATARLTAALWPCSVAGRARSAAMSRLAAWRETALRGAADAPRGLQRTWGRLTGAIGLPGNRER
ncbi:MAG: transglutaminaseTgpA domain-containing protein, partial [Mycobacteriales bacterium]